jgi:hypothetical protein
LILRSNMSIVSAIPGDHFEHVNAKWYATIGAPLVGTMFIQFLTPAIVKIVTYAVTTFKALMNSGKPVTQHALNELMAPVEFNIAASFGEVLTAATVCLLFGGGIPILYWIAAAGFTLRCVLWSPGLSGACPCSVSRAVRYRKFPSTLTLKWQHWCGCCAQIPLR